MAKKLKFDIDDDTWGDMIDVFLGKPYPTDNYDLDSNFTLRLNPRTKKMVGLIILQFSALFPDVSDRKARQLVAEALFKVLDHLYREKALKDLKVA